jgi:hypothetical protein
MHGLVNRSVQSFLADTYGAAFWSALSARIGVPESGFEAMLTYDDATTDVMMAEASRRLSRPREALLEDLGTYLVSHPRMERLRRLLRFGGTNFLEFLQSLEDMPERGRLAVPDLELPLLEVEDEGAGAYLLHVRGGPPGCPAILTGVLRAMADDYGALAVIEMLAEAGYGAAASCDGPAPALAGATPTARSGAMWPFPTPLPTADDAGYPGPSEWGADAAMALSSLAAPSAPAAGAASPSLSVDRGGEDPVACGTVRIHLHDPEFSEGRRFELAFSRAE